MVAIAVILLSNELLAVVYDDVNVLNDEVVIKLATLVILAPEGALKVPSNPKLQGPTLLAVVDVSI